MEPVALASYEICESLNEDSWTLLFFPDAIGLQTAGGHVHEFARANLSEKVQVLDTLPMIRPMLLATLGNKRVYFNLSPKAYSALKNWIGTPTEADLKTCLKRHYKLMLPAGILVLLLSFPSGELPSNPTSLALGSAMILLGILASWRPHRIYLAIGSLLCSVIAANIVWLLIHRWSWLWLISLLFVLAAALFDCFEYRRFGQVCERDIHRMR